MGLWLSGGKQRTAGDLWWLQSVREVKSCKLEEGRFGFYLAVCIALLICAFTWFWHLNSTDFQTHIEDNVLLLSAKGSFSNT